MNTLLRGLKDMILPDSHRHATQRSIFYNLDRTSRGITPGGDYLSVIMSSFQEVLVGQQFEFV